MSSGIATPAPPPAEFSSRRRSASPSPPEFHPKAEKARLEEAQDAMMAVISAKNAKINAHAAQLLSPTFLGDDDSVLSYRLQIAPNQYTTFSMKQCDDDNRVIKMDENVIHGDVHDENKLCQLLRYWYWYNQAKDVNSACSNDAITNEEVSITTIEGSCVSVAIVDNFTETLRKTEQKIIALAKSFSAAS